MNKNIPTIITISALVLALGACTPEQRHEKKISKMPPGSYESTETITDAQGTKTVKTSTTVVTIDEHGNRKEVITSKISRDPEGLMNKTTKKTKRVTEEKY